MPKSPSAQAIIFAIHSALRLSRNIQRAYANSLKSKSVLLPLPSFDHPPNPFTINRFFDLEGARFVEQIEALKYLHRKNQVELLSPEESAAYQEYYRSLYFIEIEGTSNPQIAEAGLYTEDLLSLLKIRQWEKDAQFASTTLQLVAGTIVETGIDYFNPFPKSIHTETVMGRALSRILGALDSIPFSQEEDFKQATSQKIIPSLFITALETIQELPEEWMRDEKLLLLIEAIVRGINEDLFERIGPDWSTDEMDEAIQWGQLMLSSLIRNAGPYIFSYPNRIFDAQQLISRTGLMLMDLLYGEEELKLDLKKLFTSHTLDILIKNIFAISSDEPELPAGDKQLRLLVGEVCLAVAESPLPLSHLLPEILRLILEKTALSPSTTWKQEKKDAGNLLVATLKSFLEALRPSFNSGKYSLSPRQLLKLLELLMEEVSKRPAWVTAPIGQDPLLSKLIQLSFEARQKMPAAQHTPDQALTQLIHLHMRAIASDTRMLDKIRWDHDEEEKMILEKLIELVSAFVSEQSASLQKTAQALNLSDLLLRKVLQHHPNHLGLRIAAFLLEEDARLQLSTGTNEAMVDRYLDTILGMLTTHPDVLAPNPHIRQLITGVAQALQESGIDRPGLLPRVLQLVLLHTAGSIELEAEDQHMKKVLLEALRQMLQALSFVPEKEPWKPVFKGDHILEIILYLLGEISENPDWVGEEPKVFQTLHTIFESLEKIPGHRRPSFSLTKLMIIKLFEAVRSHPEYFNIISSVDEEEKIVLAVTLEYLFEAIYEQPNTKATLDILHQPSVMDAMLDYYLYRTSLHPIEENDIREAADQVAEAVKKLNEGHLNGAEEFLDSYQSPPE